jgi:hypothetical protein
MKCGVAARAYRKAGYEPITRNGLDAAASRLARSGKVQSRIKELRRQMAKRNAITVDSLLDDLAADRELARRLEQPSAAIAATQLAARLCGLLVDRKESGAPGEFSNLQSADEVLALVRAEFGNETAALLAAALGKRESEQEQAALALDTPRDEATPLN